MGDHKIIPFAETPRERLEEIADEYDGFVIGPDRSGYHSVVVDVDTETTFGELSPTEEEKELIEDALEPSFKEYLAEHYGFDEDSALWSTDTERAEAEVETRTGFYKDTRAFSEDDRVKIVYAHSSKDYVGSYISVGLADASN